MLKIDLNKSFKALNGEEFKDGLIADFLAVRLNDGWKGFNSMKSTSLAQKLYDTKCLEVDKADLKVITDNIESLQNGSGPSSEPVKAFIKAQLLEALEEKKEPKESKNKRS